MIRANNDIRTYAKEKNVALWMIAKHLNISEPTITRWFRVELDPDRKKMILQAIDEMVEAEKKC